MPSTDFHTGVLLTDVLRPDARRPEALRTPAPRLSAESLPQLAEADLLDSPAAWGGVTTRSGFFRLEPVRLDRDLDLLTGWMNDPQVDAYWELSGPAAVTAAHVWAQRDGGSRNIRASASSTTRR